MKVNLTVDMATALADLCRNGDGIRGPSNTGLSVATYRGLERRGLAEQKKDAYQKWRPTDVGREVHEDIAFAVIVAAGSR